MAFKTCLIKIALCACCVFSSYIAYAQTAINIAGKIYTIPIFSNDTLTWKEQYVKEDSLLIAYRFTRPLVQSSYDFEARCFVKTTDIAERFVMIILTGNKHKLTAELYDCRYVAILTDGTPGIKLGQYESIWIHIDEHRINLKTDTNFTRLIEAGLFNFPDKIFFQNGKDSPTMEDVYHSDYVIEVKLNGKYHSFRYNPNLSKSGSLDKTFFDGKAIINAFFDLAKCKRLM